VTTSLCTITYLGERGPSPRRSQGADDELLAIIGSYRDTLPDESILKSLRDWNAGQPVIRTRQ
jgi:hypothetical protein